MAQIAYFAVMAISALNEGAQKRKVAYAASEGLTDAADRRMTAASLDASDEAKKKDYIESRAISAAAASGAGVDDPTVINLIGDLNTEGEYRIMQKLWVGQDEAEGLRYQAEVKRREGEAALNQAYMNAATTVMSAYTKGIGSSWKAEASSLNSSMGQGYLDTTQGQALYGGGKLS